MRALLLASDPILMHTAAKHTFLLLKKFQRFRKKIATLSPVWDIDSYNFCIKTIDFAAVCQHKVAILLFCDIA